MVTIDSTLQLLTSPGLQQDSFSPLVVNIAPHAMIEIAKSSENISFSEKSEKSDKTKIACLGTFSREILKQPSGLREFERVIVPYLFASVHKISLVPRYFKWVD
jgi:hypothetical protein